MWTLDGHMIQVYEDEASARRYHEDMREQGHLERPGVRCVVWDVDEVGCRVSGAVGASPGLHWSS